MSVLLYLFYFKLINYAAFYKIEEHHSRIDIVFLAVVFVLLYSPLFYLKHKNPDYQFAKLLINEKINFDFPKQFETNFDSILKNEKIVSKFLGVYQKFNRDPRWDEGYYFAKDNRFFIHNLTLDALSDTDSERILQKLIRFRNFCNENNIALYINMHPMQEDVYFNGYKIPKNEKAPQAYKILKENGFNVIYSKDTFMQNKDKVPIFFKTDNHLTDEGAYLAYLDIINELKKKFDKIVPVSEEQFSCSEQDYVDFEFVSTPFQGWRIRPDAKYPKTKYKYIEVAGIPHTVKVDEEKRVKISNCPTCSPYKLAYIGTSFGDQLNEYFMNSFEGYYRFRSNWAQYFVQDQFLISRFEQDILDFKPDILILNILDSEYLRFDTLYKE